MAGVEGLEPPTSGFGDRRSSQLSYTPTGPARSPPRDTLRQVAQGRLVERGRKNVSPLESRAKPTAVAVMAGNWVG
jgi:hypothetical protein